MGSFCIEMIYLNFNIVAVVPGFASYDTICAYCRFVNLPQCNIYCAGQRFGPSSTSFGYLGQTYPQPFPVQPYPKIDRPVY